MMKAESVRRSNFSEFSDDSSVPRVAGFIPFTWEEQPGIPKPISHTPRSPRQSLEDSAVVNDEAEGPETRSMRLNLKASLMGVHYLDDETEMFFSRELSNPSCSNNSSTRFRTAGTVPFKWETEPGKPIESAAKFHPCRDPLLPPPGSRLESGGQMYSNQLQRGLGPVTVPSAGSHLSDLKIFRKLVGQSRMPSTKNMSLEGSKSIRRKRGEVSSGNQLGKYSINYGGKYEEENVSPVSTLDLPNSLSSPSSSERHCQDTRRKLHKNVMIPPPPPTGHGSRLAHCLLSITAMNDDTSDEDDIMFEWPGPSAVVGHHPQEHDQSSDQPGWHQEWQMVNYGPDHHVRSSSQSTAPTHERWSSNSSSWNLSLEQKPLKTVANHRKDQTSRESPRQSVYSRDHCLDPMISGVLKYDRNGDIYGRQRWERDSDRSLSRRMDCVDEIMEFEAYNRPEEVIHIVDEEDFPFSPVASSFVFGDGKNGVECSARGKGIPKAVGPIVQEFPRTRYDLHEYRDTTSIASSEDSLMYSLEGGVLQEQQWVPTKSFHLIKGTHGMETVNLGCSSRVFGGYWEITRSDQEMNKSGRFSIELQRGPRLERQKACRSNANDKTPDVLLRLVKDSNILHKKRADPKVSCVQCLPVKGIIGRCLSLNNRSRLPELTKARLGSLNEKSSTGSPFRFS